MARPDGLNSNMGNFPGSKLSYVKWAQAVVCNRFDVDTAALVNDFESEGPIPRRTDFVRLCSMILNVHEGAICGTPPTLNPLLRNYDDNDKNIYKFLNKNI
nr:hypothetical protein [uncultured Desulfobulbus sp.]